MASDDRQNRLGEGPVESDRSRQEGLQAARNSPRPQREAGTATPLTGVNFHSRQDVIACLALGLLVLVCYLPAMLWGGFVWDDHLCIKVDPVRDVSGLVEIWFSPSAIAKESHYWPLVYTTFWLEHKLWGFDPKGYHIVNVLLHLVNTFLVWHILRRMAVTGAWMVAAVFAVHPLHVESVAWVIERKDVLSGLFYLFGVVAWMRFVERPGRGRYAAALVLYAAGLLSKSIVVTLPVALLVWHWWKQGRITSIDLLRLVPFGVVGLVITISDLSFSRSVAPLSLDYSLTERTLIAARALWFYAAKLLWPSDLAVIYPMWDIQVADPVAWGYFIGAVVLALAFWHLRSRIGRGPMAGALFFAVTLSPVLGFVDYTYMWYAFVADRFQYLAGLGVMAVLIGSAENGVRRLSSIGQKAAVGIAAMILVALGIMTWRQAGIYRNDETFHRHIIALNPKAPNAHRHLGNFMYKEGRYEEALEMYRIAAEQRPNYAKVHSNLGGTLNKLGRFEEGEIHLRRAIELDPKAKHRQSYLGDALYGQGRYVEALDAYRIAAERYPGDARILSSLGAALNELGHLEEAETHLRRAIALNPRERNAHLHLGVSLHSQRRYAEAVEAYRVAAEQRPGDARTHSNLGAALNELGHLEEAETHLRHAIALNPNLTRALYFLSSLRFKQQNYDEMLELLQRLIAIDPDDAGAHARMGVALFYLGRSEEALQRFDQALSLDPTLDYARANRKALLEVVGGN